jgi:hypothetical protein
MENLLTSDREPNGKIIFSEWLRANRDRVGKAYASELSRHYKWKKLDKK